MKTIRLFISSPGDVVRERQIAERVVARLNVEFAGRVRLDPYFWEYEPMRLDRNFEDQIPPTSEFDLLICILWSRLGTPLKGSDGREWASGTEYEVGTGLESYQARGAPELMIYLNRTPAQIRQLPREERERQMRQLEALENFVRRFCFDPQTGVIKGAFTNYEDLGQFEERLEQHLRKVLVKKSPVARPEDKAAIPAAPRWTGNPFRGLQVFESEHADVFFGRTRAIGEVIGALRRQGQQVEEARLRLGGGKGEAEGFRAAAFVLVTGMSGIGKSSLVRAGILPLLTQPGDGIGLWRRAVLRPGESSGDLFDGLAAAFAREGALPELVRGGQTAPELAGLLRGAPGAINLLISQALTHAADLQCEQEKHGLRESARDFAKEGRPGDAERCERLAEGLAPKPARLVLVVDQMEELFSLEKVTAQQRQGFVSALGALSRSGWVYVLGTLRSDFFARCAELPELMALKQGDGLYHLQPPTPGEVAQMVRQPALAAGLRFEGDGVNQAPLDEVIRDAALKNPEALPLLEFCLDQLYQRRTAAGVLTHEAYRAMGELAGAIGQKAEESFQKLQPTEREAFEAVMRQVTTVALEKQETFNRRWADYAELASSPAAKSFADAFCSPQGRLFVTSRTDDGRAIVSVAHEALLSQWPRLAKWLEVNRENLKIRAEVALATSYWREAGRNADYLLPGGLPLAKARQALEAGFLEEAEKEFVRASIARVEAQARRRTRMWQGVAAGFAFLALLAGAGGVVAWHQKQQAQRAGAVARHARQTAEGLINSMLFDLSDKLEPIGRLDLLDDVSRKAEDYFRNLPQAELTGDVLRNKAVMFRNRGDVLLAQGKLKAAREAYQQGMEISRRLAQADPTKARAQLGLGVSYDKLGDVAQKEGDLKAAREAYQQSMEISRRLAQADPTNAQAQRDLSVSYNNLGIVALQEGDLKAAREACQQGMEISRRLAQADPTNAEAQRGLRLSYERLGDVALQEGDLKAAREAYQQGMEISRRLAQADPTNVQAQRDLSISYNRLGDVAQKEGNLKAAREAYQQDMEISRRLAQTDPTNAQAQRELFVSYNNLGIVAQKERNLKAAREAYQQGMEISRRLAQTDLTNAEAQRDLSVSYNNLGIVAQKEGDLEAAREAYQQGMDIRRRLVQANPTDARARRDLASAYGNMAELELSWRRPKEAIAAAEAGLKADPAEGWIKVNLAHGYLFDGQYEKAKELYLANRAVKLNDEQTFADAVLDDFRQFREKGLSHPDMEKIEKLLREGAPR